MVARYWKMAFYLAAYTGAAMIGGYFLIRATLWQVATPERIRAYGTAVVDHAFDWADRLVRGDAAVRAQAQEWVKFPTELQDLEMNVIALSPTPTRAGAMTQLDGGFLLAATGEGDFIGLDTNTAAHTRAEITSPINLATFKAHPLWNTPGLNRKWFRINDIFAVKRGEGAYTLYATHHWFTPECMEFRLSRTDITIDGGLVRQTGAWKKIFTATPCFPVLGDHAKEIAPFAGHLSGGRMLDFDAQHLLMTVGDQWVFEGRAVDVSQDPTVTMGKILLVDKETGETSIFAMGERNAQGLLRDSRGRIWETEHGPHGGDELNLVHEGSNLGWPKVTYGVNYDMRPWPGATTEGRHEGFQPPVYAWLPSIGVTNLVEAPGDAFPNWRGDLLVGSLRASSLFRIRLEGNDAIYAEQIGMAGRAVRDIEVLPDGRIAVLDNRFAMVLLRNGAGHGKGRIYDAESATVPHIVDNGLSKKRLALARHGAEIFGAQCAECHSLVGGASAGPQLRNVAERNIGAEAGFEYSSALKRAPGAWNEAALARFLADPESLGDTVAMPNQGLTAGDSAALAAYLVELRRQDRRGRQKPHRPGDAVAGTPGTENPRD
ncbi:MAG: PQQ-dependent sugar dehydrogenase [Alphaproteobacteria bacterium]|nr:PQQ-dependent sugar dehydrogenase [Alphaproteobacteria bacterium]MDZ4777422.1 PQQ-dependent sugar dehydrogenase [Alphaproteobacteria bacterium]